MILHINSYYFTNSIYSNLYAEIEKEIKQIVYIPIKQNVILTENPYNILVNTDLIISRIIEPKHRILYFNKIEILYKDLLQKVDFSKIRFIHAHNLFIDGVLAYKIFKEFKIKYCVSVRMTDVSLQYKYMIHRRMIVNKAILNAEQVINISPIYEKLLINNLPTAIKSTIQKKCLVIPNGINRLWFENKKSNKKVISIPFKLIYIGQIIKRKNILNTISAIQNLISKGIKIEFTIIGGENIDQKSFYKTFLKEIEKHDFINYKGKVSNIERLKEILLIQHGFIMVPNNELFGVVYIEALSQNLPVIYSEGEGISGFLNDKNVGVSVNPNNIAAIENGILDLINNYSKFQSMRDISEEFNWEIISKKYLNLYN